MKKLLTILTTFSLITPTINTIVSCNNRPKYIPDDDSKETTNDVEIMNKLMSKVSQHLKTWLAEKATIDINNYPDQIAEFKELVTHLKTNDGEVLTGATISKWRFLDQLVTGFKTEFNNLNRDIANEYSNFYLQFESY
ncbi:lipoprotein [Spiroplasma endosymbiont of Sarcophaga carnaria]|uniref:lipoprotein n=2 Tax=unclassified Spiroplasma TaxID=2637901 RepID=UPI0030CE005D